MKYTSILSSLAVLLTAPLALADDGPSLVGAISAGYTFEKPELDWGDGSESLDAYSINTSGAVLFGKSDNVQFQGNFDFDAHTVEICSDCGDATLDQWAIGGKVFTRKDRWMIGFEADYRREDFLAVIDGYRVGLRSEIITNEKLTWTMAFGYNHLDTDLCDDCELSGFDVNAGLTAYPSENVSISGRVGFDERDMSGLDADLWSFGAGLEWLIPNQPISLTLDVDYYDGQGNWGGPSDIDFENLQVGFGVKFYFGTSGSIANHHRGGTLDTDLGPSFLEFIAFD